MSWPEALVASAGIVAGAWVAVVFIRSCLS